MTQRPLGEQEFEGLLDRHGADLSAWPGAEQDAAAALLTSSASARRAFAGAQLLETALRDALAPVPPPLGLRARILARAERRDAEFGWLTGNAWRFVGVACAPLLLGFGLGVAFGLDGVASADIESRVLLAFSDSDFADLEVPEPSASEGLAPRRKEPSASEGLAPRMGEPSQ